MGRQDDFQHGNDDARSDSNMTDEERRQKARQQQRMKDPSQQQRAGRGRQGMDEQSRNRVQGEQLPADDLDDRFDS